MLHCRAYNKSKMEKLKYNPFEKLILGIPEVLFFLIRYIRGIYDLK